MLASENKVKVLLEREEKLEQKIRNLEGLLESYKA